MYYNVQEQITIQFPRIVWNGKVYSMAKAMCGLTHETNKTEYHIAGNYQGRKLSRISKK